MMLSFRQFSAGNNVSDNKVTLIHDKICLLNCLKIIDLFRLKGSKMSIPSHTLKIHTKTRES